MEKKFARHFSSLDEIFEFITLFSKQTGMNETVLFQVNLAVEELFTNMIKYNPDNPNDILIRLFRDSEGLNIILVDFDVDRFDIRTAKKFDPDQPMEERRRGGMGLHLVTKIMDKVEYDYKNRTSTITLIKLVENDYDQYRD